MTKYIFVTGGVVSGLGKGITAASLGRLLKQRGLKVINQKFDPYINVDPGTMSPYQHGEVFVTEDGLEGDLDLGHYERFIDENLNVDSNITTGKVYSKVIKMERNGDFDGKTVQVVPHITNEIKDAVYRVARHDKKVDVVITEIGGTVGDIESHPFLEAIRQVPFDVGRENVLYVHVTLIPYISSSGELKTKPTQHSVKELQNIGISPDVIVCRTEKELDSDSKNKISLFCNVTKDAVIQNRNARVLYEIPLMLEREGFANVVMAKLNLKKKEDNLCEWEELVEKILNLPEENVVTIGLVGKYVELRDAYISIAEALKHGGYSNGVNVEIEWIQAEDITKENVTAKLKGLDGIIVPGGFGERGVLGMRLACEFARKNNIPYFGVCLGMQLACVEFAQNVMGLKGAGSTEFGKNVTDPIIHILPDKKPNADLGGTLRLGAYPCVVKKGTKAHDIYNADTISERHRHRYEYNNNYIDKMEASGMTVCGMSPDKTLVEMVEITSHKWFVGVQFHPEFKSRPNKPHPLFASFIKAASEK